MSVARGDIRWFRFAFPDKRRPVLVLGDPALLPSLAQVVVIPLSTAIRGFPWEVQLSEKDGMPSACVLKPEWIRAVDRTLIGPRIGTLQEARLTEVRAALLRVLGLT